MYISCFYAGVGFFVLALCIAIAFVLRRHRRKKGSLLDQSPTASIPGGGVPVPISGLKMNVILIFYAIAIFMKYVYVGDHIETSALRKLKGIFPQELG